jgi:predicted PurR-regulated permease PerM
MSDSQPANRDYLVAVLAGVLFIALLLSVREILIPPVVLAFVVATLWPLRGRSSAQLALITAIGLTLIWALHKYGGLLDPFLLALVLAYLIAPLVKKLEARRVSRGLAILLVSLPPLALAIVLGAIALPQLWEQASSLAHRAPQAAETVMGALGSIRGRIETIPFLTPAQRSYVHDFDATRLGLIIQQNADDILQRLGAWAWSAVQQVGTIFGFLAYVIVTPVVAFYLLRDWPKGIVAAEEMIPPSHRSQVIKFVSDYDEALGRFLRGQFLEATLVGTLTTIGLAVLGVPSALLIGVISAFSNLIPYVGFVIGLVPALLIGLTMPSPVSGVLRVAAVYGVVQFIDGNITGPRITGESVGLHPVVVMLALALGGAVLGFVGLLLAIPIAVLVKQIMTLVTARYKQSGVYAG